MPVDRTLTEGLADDVVAIYGGVESRLLSLIATHLAAGTDAPDWATAKLAELGLLRRRAERMVQAATTEATGSAIAATSAAYVRGQAVAQGDVEGWGRDLDAPPTHAERAVRALAGDAAGNLQALGVRIVRSTLDAYRDAVLSSAAGTLTGTTTRVQDAQRVLDQLARRGLTGFVDANGRRWQATTYAEMAVRSTTARAAVSGHLDRLEQAGIDLVVVSNSPRECDTCRPWEGKVLSRRAAVPTIMVNPATGERVRVDVDGTVDQATGDGLFHPNCTHSLSGYLPGVTTIPQGTANPEGYEQRQQLRHLERGVREWKRREAVALTPEAKTAARAKVREWQGRIREHTDRSGLIRQRRREQVRRAY